MTEVQIYNAGGHQLLGTVSLRHAIRMLHRQVAHVREAVEGATFGPWPMPRSVELVQYVYTKWMYDRTGQVPFSKAGMLRRDRYRCAYCGRPGASTIDHVIPRCQSGGVTSWRNCVTACSPCNEAKAGRTPAQAGMRLLFEPYVPTVADLYPRRTSR